MKEQKCDVISCFKKATKDYGTEKFCEQHYNETIEVHKKNKVGDYE